jgi:peptidoglycan hydrolase-like protein with peptidoglycan-binding domain
MKKYLITTLLALALITTVSVGSVNAATALTQAQVNAVIGLLQAFGADQATITNVQAALNGQAVSNPNPNANTSLCHAFNNEFGVGYWGTGGPGNVSREDLIALKAILVSEGLATSRELGSLSTGHVGAADPYFDQSVAGVVKKFQAKYNIRQTGFVGPVTRAKLNMLYGCTNEIMNLTNFVSVVLGSVKNYTSTSTVTYVKVSGVVVAVHENNILLTDGGGHYLVAAMYAGAWPDSRETISKINPGQTITVKGAASVTTESSVKQMFGTVYPSVGDAGVVLMDRKENIEI